MQHLLNFRFSLLGRLLRALKAENDALAHVLATFSKSPLSAPKLYFIKFARILGLQEGPKSVLKKYKIGPRVAKRADKRRKERQRREVKSEVKK